LRFFNEFFTNIITLLRGLILLSTLNYVNIWTLFLVDVFGAERYTAFWQVFEGFLGAFISSYDHLRAGLARSLILPEFQPHSMLKRPNSLHQRVCRFHFHKRSMQQRVLKTLGTSNLRRLVKKLCSVQLQRHLLRTVFRYLRSLMYSARLALSTV
jgi:hypothetical protein